MATLSYPDWKKRFLEIGLFFVPFLIVFFLFYIDEGFYDLRWMSDSGNWVVFFLYWMAMVLGEFVVAFFLPANWEIHRKMGVIIAVGIPIGLFVLIRVLFLH